MIRSTDNLVAVAQAFRSGEIPVEELHLHVEPRLERIPERERRRIVNELERAVYTLPEAARRVRLLEILEDAHRLVSALRRPDASDT